MEEMFHFLASPGVAINNSQSCFGTSGKFFSQQHCKLDSGMCNSKEGADVVQGTCFAQEQPQTEGCLSGDVTVTRRSAGHSKGVAGP